MGLFSNKKIIKQTEYLTRQPTEDEMAKIYAESKVFRDKTSAEVDKMKVKETVFKVAVRTAYGGAVVTFDTEKEANKVLDKIKNAKTPDTWVTLETDSVSPLMMRQKDILTAEIQQETRFKKDENGHFVYKEETE